MEYNLALLLMTLPGKDKKEWVKGRRKIKINTDKLYANERGNEIHLGVLIMITSFSENFNNAMSNQVTFFKKMRVF